MKPVKIGVCGDGAVGKSTLLERLVTGNEPEKNINMTIGVEICSLKLANTGTRIVFWDLGGQKRFRFIHRDYLKGIKAVIMMYAVDNYHSFKDLSTWLELIPQKCQISCFLLGNKIDTEHRMVSAEEARDWARVHQFSYFEVSARTGEGVQEFLSQFYNDLEGHRDNINQSTSKLTVYSPQQEVM